MRPIRFLIATGITAASIGLAPGGAQALTRGSADQRFSVMVLKHIGKKSPGNANCEPADGDRFRCAGRWTRTVLNPQGRVKRILRAKGGVFENTEMIRSKAQLTKWKIVDGVKRGPFKGAFLMSTSYKPIE